MQSLKENESTPIRRPSLKPMYAPLGQAPSTPPGPSTNKIILDYLLYLSIQSRLQQAQIELLELSTPLPEDNNSMKQRKKRWIDTARKAKQDKNAVELIVAGILSSHRNIKPTFTVDPSFQLRLHLCQLTNLVFGRFDVTSAGHHVIARSSFLRRRRHDSYIEAEHNESADMSRRQQLYRHPVLPSFCRRHRLQQCQACQSQQQTDKPDTALPMRQLPNIELEDEPDTVDSASSSVSPASRTPSLPLPAQPAGLIEAIPAFLQTSADLLRCSLESSEGTTKSLSFAGQEVMGGGMPPRWYDLFLELLTQAAIESYLCDAHTGLQPIFEIFSYGEVEDEDEEDDLEEENGDAGEHAVNEEEWGIEAADHHLLFPKTRTMYLFKTQVREREKEFLVAKEDDDIKAHMETLARKYPLEVFEKSMGEFIQMIVADMDTPALDKDAHSHESSIVPSLSGDALPSSSEGMPSLYKYPGDGSLLMPEIPDMEESSQDEQTMIGDKRRASASFRGPDDSKRPS